MACNLLKRRLDAKKVPYNVTDFDTISEAQLEAFKNAGFRSKPIVTYQDGPQLKTFAGMPAPSELNHIVALYGA